MITHLTHHHPQPLLGKEYPGGAGSAYSPPYQGYSMHTTAFLLARVGGRAENYLEGWSRGFSR